MSKRILSILCFLCITTGLTLTVLSLNHVKIEQALFPKVKEKELFSIPNEFTQIREDQSAKITEKKTVFKNGDIFWMNRYEFLPKTQAMLEDYSVAIEIPGKNMKIRYVSLLENGEKKWIETEDYTKLAKTTLFIETDSYHLILSVPAVYKKQESYGTIEIVKDAESPIKITESTNGYMITAKFPQNNSFIGELWALASTNQLRAWDDSQKEIFMSHDLAYERRFSMEGYYFPTPSNYIPSGENVFHKIATCYTGGSFSRLHNNSATTDLGYVLMRASMQNQNQMGYWPTYAKSQWLYDDFGIEDKFYDTRFNNDFASNLLYAYDTYHDKRFLDFAIKYANFYMDYINQMGYESGDYGVLVPDYWHKNSTKATHVSLNHHLSGLDFMLRLYNVTKDPQHRDMAFKLLMGVSHTQNEWVLPNKNLKYALHYNGYRNDMADYPYLTYNDLFITNQLLLKFFDMENNGITYLMSNKRAWMDANKITEYKK